MVLFCENLLWDSQRLCLYNTALCKDNAWEADMKEFLENHSGLQNGLALVYRFLGGTRKKIKGSRNQVRDPIV